MFKKTVVLAFIGMIITSPVFAKTDKCSKEYLQGLFDLVVKLTDVLGIIVEKEEELLAEPEEYVESESIDSPVLEVAKEEYIEPAEEEVEEVVETPEEEVVLDDLEDEELDEGDFIDTPVESEVAELETEEELPVEEVASAETELEPETEDYLESVEEELAEVPEDIEWERKRWVEITVKTALRPERNLPDTEESEDMVNTECIKVLRHLCKTSLPPCISVLSHPLPIVCRETPVLSVSRECIRWCTCL